jgi:hypothetical protein
LNPSSITVPAGQTFTINATVSIDTATSGDTTAFREAAGVVLLTPTGGTNNGVSLRVPYYAVLRPQTAVNAQINPRLSPAWTQSFVKVTNNGAELGGTADFYAWNHRDALDGQGYVDVNAVGAQAFDNAGSRLIVFAVNTHRQWFSPSLLEFDIPIDTNLDGSPDFVAVGIDLGQLQATPTFTGQIVSAVVDLSTGGISVLFQAFAPTNGSTMLIPVDSTQIGLTADNPRFSYSVQTFDLASANEDSTDGTATFNAFSSSVSNGDFIAVAPGQVSFVPVSLDVAENALSPSLGNMIVAVDNHGGTAEARLLPLR